MKQDEHGRLIDDPIHCWFGLTYSSYLVLPRMALEAMPLDWQRRFLALMDEAEEIGLEPPDYHVLRNDPSFTRVGNYDPDDETSNPHQFTIIRSDPWANYRHPDQSLLPPNLRQDPHK